MASSSDSSSCNLSLSCSFSSFEDSEPDDDTAERSLQSYQYEPLRSSESSESDSQDEDEARLQNTDWLASLIFSTVHVVAWFVTCIKWVPVNVDIAWLCPLAVRAFAVAKWTQLLLRKKRRAMKSRAL